MTIKKFLKMLGIVVICVALVVVFLGCQGENNNVYINSTNNESDLGKQQTDSDNFFALTQKAKKLNIKEQFYLGISGECFYYMSKVNYDSDICNYDIMRYNLKTDKTEKIGEIANLSTWSGGVSFVNTDMLYATFGVVENEKSCNIHVQIDLKSCEVTVLSKDNCFPPLIQNIAVNENCFVEYQPQQLEDGSYKYVVRVIDIKSGKAKDIIVKDRKTDYSGEMIVDASVYADMIYTFEYDAQTAYVCSYDLGGNQISKENVEYINEFLSTPDDITGDTETMWSIDVINGYYFFESLNGKRLVLYKKGSDWIKREDLIMNRVGSISNLIDDFNPRGNDYTKVVLYDYNTEELSYLDTVTGEKINLNVELPGATYCMTDGKQLIYANEKQELYYIEDVYAK